MKTPRFNLLASLAVATAVSFGLAGCGGSDSTQPEEPMEPMPPTAEERAAEQMALIDSTSAGLATALMGLDTASPTPAQIAAVDAAINLLDSALAGGVDLSPNQTADARSQLASARMTVSDAQTTHAAAMDLAERRTAQMGAITEAQTGLTTALGALMADDADSIAAVNTAITMLQGAVDAAADLTDAEKMSAMSALMGAEVSAAQAELDMYTAAAMAEGASDEDMLAAYEMKLTAAQRLKAAGAASAADLEKANTIIGTATAKIAQLKMDIADAAEAKRVAEQAVLNAAATQVAKAIEAHKVMGETRDKTMLPDAFKDDSAGEWGVSRDSDGVKVTLNQATPVAEKDKYASAAVGSIGTAPEFAGQQFTRDSKLGQRPVIEVAVVYTDIKAAGGEAWGDYFGSDTGYDAATGLVALANRPAADSGNADTASRFSPFVLPFEPATQDTNRVRTIPAATNIIGTYYGVAGTYRCPGPAGGTACTVTRLAAGDVVTVVGLTFTPLLDAADVLTGDAATVKALSADPDSDYTHFGYWMRSITQRDDTMDHNVETFHGGVGDIAADLGLVEGTASYYGSAAGVYVKEDGEGNDLEVTNGMFTANAVLKASFGGTAIAASKQNMVSGTISGFMDGDTDLRFGDLTLESTRLGADDAIATDNDVTTTSGPVHGRIATGETNGGGTSGNWTGRFYGNAGSGTTATLPNGRPAASDDFPANVSGEFNGHFTNGHVAGAFGAEKDTR